MIEFLNVSRRQRLRSNPPPLTRALAVLGLLVVLVWLAILFSVVLESA